MTGRPRLYSEELANEICERLANGEPLRRICQDPAMPGFTTIWQWQRDNEAFSKLSSRAREQGTHNLADQCIDIADNEDLDPQHKRLMIDTRIRLIGKWNSKAYGDKITQEHQGPDGGPVQITEIRHTIIKPEVKGE